MSREAVLAPLALGHRIELKGGIPAGAEHVLTPEAIAFVTGLDNAFAARRCELLAARRERAERVTAGWDPDFDPATADIRDDLSWQVCTPAPGLLDRRVELTCPPERRIAAEALTSGAQVWVADLEDAHSPTWANVVQAQATLLDVVEADAGPVTIMVRPRGWHMVDKSVLIDGRPVSATLLDFGLYFFHCAARQVARGSGPYFYLPKLESHLEARLWNDVFVEAQEQLGLARGTVRATALVETIFAAFEMDEILYELREHSAGLSAGRWDYLFSIVKTFAERGDDYLLPDRSEITSTAPFMDAHSQLLVDTCHRRGAHAIGGVSAFIPGPDEAENRRAIEEVRVEKSREVEDGFDGSWVAHVDLVATCRSVFDARLGTRPHQIAAPRTAAKVTREELLAISKTSGEITEEGVRANVGVSLRYIEAWLRGSGAVPIFGQLEDASTAEIARCQLWQWIRAGATTAEGTLVDRTMVLKTLDRETVAAAHERGTGCRLSDARIVVEAVTLADELPPFFTTWAYPRRLVR